MREKMILDVSLIPLVNMWWPRRGSRRRRWRGSKGYCLIPEIVFRAKTGNIRDHAHGGEDHDVDRGMGVYPEKVLEEDRVPSLCGIEEPYAEHSLQDKEEDSDGEDGVARICVHAVA